MNSGKSKWVAFQNGIEFRKFGIKYAEVRSIFLRNVFVVRSVLEKMLKTFE